ncbi:MAG: hypothetical protein HY903_05675 [Deltaproteobacteria bacterium]|nr:hypothetical protein [Deltaproteobacteria bacterium]
MNKQILGYKCKKCGHVQYPYHSRCKKCGHTEWRGFDIVFDTAPLPQDGKLLTFTHLYALPPDFEAVTVSFGIVELSDGHRITGQLKIEAPKIGMKVQGKVELVRQEGYTKHWGLVFYSAA